MVTPTSSDLHLEYRSLLRLDDLGNAEEFDAVIDQDVREWLDRRMNVNKIAGGFDPLSAALPPTMTVDSFEFSSEIHRGVSRRITVTEQQERQVFVLRVYAIPELQGSHFLGNVIIDGLTESNNEDGALPTLDPADLAHFILEERNVIDGSTQLKPHAQLIYENDEGAVQQAYKAIMDPHRQVTVIIAAADSSSADWERISRSLALHSAGKAATFTLWAEATDALNTMLPEHLRVAPGTVRTYLAGVDSDDTTDGMRHTVFGFSSLVRWLWLHSPFGQLLEDPSTRLPGLLPVRAGGGPAELPTELRRIIGEVDGAAAKAERQAVARERVSNRVVPSIVRAGQPGLTVPSHWWDHLRHLFNKWLGIDRPTSAETVPGDLDALDALLEEKDHLWTLAEEASTHHIRRITRLEAQVDAARNLTETQQIEVYERQEQIDELLRRSEYYRSQLVFLQRADLLAGAEEDDGWGPPADMEELATRLGPASDSKAARYVRFTGQLRSMHAFTTRDPWGTLSRDAWNMVHALHDYAEMKADGSFAGNFHDYLAADDVTGFQVSAHRHASRESSQVEGNRRWFESRVFPVPAQVNPSGHAYMGEHFRIATKDSFAPRMHFLDDTAETGMIYIGYIGKHLPNTRSN